MTQIQALIREILGEDYLMLRVERFTFEEHVATREGTIRCELAHEASGDGQVIEGRGVGILDAFFRGLKEHFGPEYPSLDTIQFASFSVRGDMDSREDPAGSDALGEVHLEVKNSMNVSFDFVHRSRSITGSSVQVTLKAAQYFVNSERAFVRTWTALQDAKARTRQDLVDTYTRHMTELVRNTSYSKVIEEIQAGLDAAGEG